MPIQSVKLPVEWVRTKAAIAAAEQRQKDPASPTRILLVNGSTRSQHTCPGRDLEDAAPRAARPAGDRVAARLHEVDELDVSALADEPLEGHLSLQGLRLDRAAAVPLAVLVLSEPRARPDRRLDGRALSPLGGGARRVHRLPGALVPRAGQPQADDRPAGLRRRRQPRLHQHRRQGPGAGQGARARRAGAIPSTSPAARSPSSPTATPPVRRTCGACWSTGSPTSA